LLEGAVGEEGHQPLARQRHMDVVELREAEVAPLDDAPGGAGVDVATERGGGGAGGGDLGGGEGLGGGGAPRGGGAVAPGVLGAGVAEEEVYGVYGGDAVALAHQPAAGDPGEGVAGEVAHVGGHHVEGAAGVALGVGLEVARR